jgi:hypothetical protein
MKDRFSLHIDDGQPEILEAFTVVRNGFTGSQKGLVGITNIAHSSNQEPIIPETIFNVQSSAESNVRFSSVSLNESTLELLSNGNTKASGLQIAYDPGSQRIHLSRLSPSGCTGIETGFITSTSNNFVGIGTTKFNDIDKFTPNSPLTIWHSGTTNSGTIAIKEQATSPSATSTFGKIFVKQDVNCGLRQSLFFLDDTGQEFNISHPSGELKTDSFNNTFGGRFAPKSAFGCATNENLHCDTVYGFAAGYKLNTGDHNTLIGCNAGSGITNGNRNTVVGSNNIARLDVSNVIVLGTDNLSPTSASDGENDLAGSIGNNILIGTGLARDYDLQPNTMLIGFGSSPVVQAGLGGTNNRFLSVNSLVNDKASISVVSENNELSLTEKDEVRTEAHNPLSNANVGIINLKDKDSPLQHKGMASLRFSNQFNDSQTLVDYVPSGLIPNSAPVFTTPSRPTPYVAISGDLYLNGSIRFADQSVLAGAKDYALFADSGVGKVQEDTKTTFILDYTSLSFASNLTPSINATSSYLALETPSGDERLVGKISIDALASYVSSGYASVSENCNMVWADVDSESNIDVVNNSGSVFIGCGVGVHATGWKNGVFLGAQAGAHATASNAALYADTAPVFIGFRAGYDADNLDNTIAIGTAAGQNADESSDSIFIGSSAGLNASGNRNSIGIGENALNGLDTPGHDYLGGNRNIEIITGLDNDERLLYSSGNLNDRINIQNVIAGDHKNKFISLGDATVSPKFPVESRRDVIFPGHSGVKHIHAYYNDNVVESTVNSSGDYLFVNNEAGGFEAWFGNHEGYVTETINAPSSYSNPTSGLMRTQTARNNFGTDNLIWVTNRDPKLAIHGPGSDGGAAFVVTMRVNGENRPVYISCSGT